MLFSRKNRDSAVAEAGPDSGKNRDSRTGGKKRRKEQAGKARETKQHKTNALSGLRIIQIT